MSTIFYLLHDGCNAESPQPHYHRVLRSQQGLFILSRRLSSVTLRQELALWDLRGAAGDEGEAEPELQPSEKQRYGAQLLGLYMQALTPDDSFLVTAPCDLHSSVSKKRKTDEAKKQAEAGRGSGLVD